MQNISDLDLMATNKILIDLQQLFDQRGTKQAKIDNVMYNRLGAPSAVTSGLPLLSLFFTMQLCHYFVQHDYFFQIVNCY